MKKILVYAPAFLLLGQAMPQATWAAGDFASYEDCLVQTMKGAVDSMTVNQVKQTCSPYLAQQKPEEETEVATSALEETTGAADSALEETTETATSALEAPPEAADSALEETTEADASALSAEQIEELPAVTRRLTYESKNQGNLFSIIPHKPNYILLASYNEDVCGEGLEMDDSELDHTEVKFQLSFKVPLTKDLFGYEDGRLYAAYTMKSLWQTYNDDISSPFRETNHEPELFVALKSNREFFGINNPYILAGFSHQSNGRGGDRSRSWNRLYLDFIFERGDYALSIKPWYRLPEGSKSYPGDPGGDDNPDITSYMGYGELTGAWAKNGHTVSVMLRNNLHHDGNRGAVELGWSFPLGDEIPLKGYLQYFNGYGESLIDYNQSVNRIGFGLLLSDWL